YTEAKSFSRRRNLRDLSSDTATQGTNVDEEERGGGNVLSTLFKKADNFSKIKTSHGKAADLSTIRSFAEKDDELSKLKSLPSKKSFKLTKQDITNVRQFGENDPAKFKKMVAIWSLHGLGTAAVLVLLVMLSRGGER
ncbi:hypothetical protein L916_19786, partial [Phytophthora nicotianae]